MCARARAARVARGMGHRVRLYGIGVTVAIQIVVFPRQLQGRPGGLALRYGPGVDESIPAHWKMPAELLELKWF